VIGLGLPNKRKKIKKERKKEERKKERNSWGSGCIGTQSRAIVDIFYMGGWLVGSWRKVLLFLVFFLLYRRTILLVKFLFNTGGNFFGGK